MKFIIVSFIFLFSYVNKLSAQDTLFAQRLHFKTEYGIKNLDIIDENTHMVYIGASYVTKTFHLDINFDVSSVFATEVFTPDNYKINTGYNILHFFKVNPVRFYVDLGFTYSKNTRIIQPQLFKEAYIFTQTASYVSLEGNLFYKNFYITYSRINNVKNIHSINNLWGKDYYFAFGHYFPLYKNSSRGLSNLAHNRQWFWITGLGLDYYRNAIFSLYVTHNLNPYGSDYHMYSHNKSLLLPGVEFGISFLKNNFYYQLYLKFLLSTDLSIAYNINSLFNRASFTGIEVGYQYMPIFNKYYSDVRLGIFHTSKNNKWYFGAYLTNFIPQILYSQSNFTEIYFMDTSFLIRCGRLFKLGKNKN